MADWVTQSIIFYKNAFTKKQARQWLKDHNYKFSKVDTTPNTYRFRQKPMPKKKPKQWGMLKLPNGIMIARYQK